MNSKRQTQKSYHTLSTENRRLQQEIESYKKENQQLKSQCIKNNNQEGFFKKIIKKSTLKKIFFVILYFIIAIICVVFLGAFTYIGSNLLIQSILVIIFATLIFFIVHMLKKETIKKNKDMSLASLGLVGGVYGAIFWDVLKELIGDFPKKIYNDESQQKVIGMIEGKSPLFNLFKKDNMFLTEENFKITIFLLILLIIAFFTLALSVKIQQIFSKK